MGGILDPKMDPFWGLKDDTHVYCYMLYEDLPVFLMCVDVANYVPQNGVHFGVLQMDRGSGVPDLGFW